MADIKTLNDNLRQTLNGGKVMLTKGINCRSTLEKIEILKKVRQFDDFTEDNDPYGEHDFGSFDHNGEKIFWKIDYYDKSYQYGSEDPSNPEVTNRVMTIMLAEEY